MKLSEISIKRPVFATMMIGALLVLGLFSYYGLPLDLFPDIDFPFATVVTIYPGGSAETVETEVTKKIEDAVNEVSGIRHITSWSRESYSLVIIEFELEKDGAQATQDVREKISGIRADLPDDIEEPVVRQFDPSASPIMSAVISGDRPAREITELTKNVIKKRLEIIDGVGSVRLVGGEEREILVAVDPDRMESYNVSIDEVTGSIMAANLEIPGGRVDESSREYLVRTMGRLSEVSQFDDIVIKNNKGVPVYLKDIARLSDTVVEKRSYSSYNGQPSVSISIIKQSGTNTVDVALRVREALARLQGEMPPDIGITIVDDNAVYIEDSVHEIIFNIQFGTALAVLVIFLFLLSVRPTIITGLSIPISIIATFTAMKMLGYTMNVLTLMGLSLAVGILIDDAIVVIENIFRHKAQGRSAMEAAFSGTKEIGLAVMATTFAIVAVFIPIAFMEGIVGRFFTQFGITVAVAVTISLFVAFTLTPMLSSRMLDATEPMSARKGLLGGIARAANVVWRPVLKVISYWNIAFEALKPRYERLLGRALRLRWLVVLIAFLSFAGAIGLVAIGLIGAEFFPQTDRGQLAVNIETPPGTVLKQTVVRFNEVEKIVRQFGEVTNIYSTIGAGDDPITTGRVLVKLTDKEERELTVWQIMDSVRTLVAGVPGINAAVGSGEEGHGGSGKSVEISIRGPEMDELTRLTHQVQQIFYDAPGATDVDNTLEEDKPEIQIDVDRKLANDLGLNLYEIPATIRTLVEGEVVTHFKEGDEEYDVRVRLDERFRASAEDVGRIMIKSGKDVPGKEVFLVPLSRVAKIEKKSSIGQYNRKDRLREVAVNANVLSGAFSGTVSNYILARINESVEVPPGYFVGQSGEAEIMGEAFRNIFKALVLAVIFIYLLLASLYESFSDPFSIMLSLPLSLIGAIIGLIGSSFSIMSLIGIVLLMGLVTKNAILLIDFVKQRREQGVSRYDAILQAGPIRLRPILMTTFAMVFGMLPLALGIGPGAELRAPMARAAIGGIISSTLLTLVVVPVVYTLIDDFVGFFRRKEKRITAIAEEESVLDQ